MILDAGLLFTGNFAATSYPAKYADNITSSGASSFFVDLAQGQTNTNAVALPPSATSPNTQPFRDLGIGDDPAMKILVQAIGGNWAPGGATLAVALQGSPDSGTGTPAGFTTYYTSTAVSGTTINSATAASTRL